jgi:hypothetical protein
VVLVAVGLFALLGLFATARRNLIEYEKSLLLLIAGSLRNRADGSRESAPCAPLAGAAGAVAQEQRAGTSGGASSPKRTGDTPPPE